MAKFNEEIMSEKFLEDKKTKEECAMYLHFLLPKEEREKLKKDWEAAGGFEAIPYWEAVFENVKVSYEFKEDLKIDEIYKLISKRLEVKRNELKERQDQFDVMWDNEKHSGCFERNAINDLLIMQQLKSEIHELEHWETLMKAQIRN